MKTHANCLALKPPKATRCVAELAPQGLSNVAWAEVNLPLEQPSNLLDIYPVSPTFHLFSACSDLKSS